MVSLLIVQKQKLEMTETTKKNYSKQSLIRVKSVTFLYEKVKMIITL